MNLTVENICGLLIRSHLLPLDTVKSTYARWQAEARNGGGEAGEFLRWLVAEQRLTTYQAGLIARGHADGFFLNEYKILDRLGQCRMAGVFKAVHTLGQVVAIKALPPSLAKDATLRARFQREARLAMRLKHPNIVRAFQLGEAAGVHYLVMEYLEGETLAEVLKRRGKLPPAEAVRLVYQALQGLQHIHEQGLIHRDLKPGNLMVVAGGPDDTSRATVKILDIGLGRALLEEVRPSGQPADEPLTVAGEVVGTPDYLAPEQARDARAADIRADIYSMGCMLYHILAGQPPFPDTNLLNQIVRHATEAPRPLREFNPAVPDGLQQIVNWMMAKDPAQRYQTPERAAQALQVFLAAGAGAPEASEAEARLRPYLNWLESEGRQPAPPSHPAVDPADVPQRPAPVAAEAPKPALSAATREPRPRHLKSRRRRHAAKPQAAPGTSSAPVRETRAAEAEPAWDVELVPALPWMEVAVSLRGLALTRRDLLMLGIGAGSVTAAGLIGMAVARLAGRKTKSSGGEE